MRNRTRENLRQKRAVIYVSVAPQDLSSHERIDWALNAIKADIAKNHGIYPYSKSRPTIQEVLRRAGLGKTFLEAKGNALCGTKLKPSKK